MKNEHVQQAFIALAQLRFPRGLPQATPARPALTFAGNVVTSVQVAPDEPRYRGFDVELAAAPLQVSVKPILTIP